MFGDGFESQPSVHCGLIINHQCLLRNKRCLLAYLYVNAPCFRHSSLSHIELLFSLSLSLGSCSLARTHKITDLRWDTGTILPTTLAPK